MLYLPPQTLFMRGMEWPVVGVLSNEWVRLEPLGQEHAAGLAEAVQDGALWKLWYTAIPAPDQMAAEIERRRNLQEQGSMVPFAVLDAASERLLGMTTYMNIAAAHRRLEIGSTWYRASAQRSAVNTAAKMLLLTAAFEGNEAIAVEFRTHFFNAASRAAIERLGAKQDGILRSHQVSAGGVLRDTVVYSIIAAEWPAVRKHLQYRLGIAAPAV